MLVNCYRGITTRNPEFTPCFGGHEIHGKVVLFTVHLRQLDAAGKLFRRGFVSNQNVEKISGFKDSFHFGGSISKLFKTSPPISGRYHMHTP